MDKEAGIERPWSHQRMVYMLTHEVYIGDVLTNKSFKSDANRQVKNRGERDQYYIEGHHEPTVSKEVFVRVRELVKRGLLNSGKVTFTQEDTAFLKNAINQDVENWRCENWQEVSDTEENDINGGII